ncbi:MAG: hypothetical protein Athens071416_33 [Parcubacteria group bacterium Athens0714_16]|nr:MAG: hypothetical protein Athens071416_33 [Parcubacteria group bacterium Athens0714_16]
MKAKKFSKPSKSKDYKSLVRNSHEHKLLALKVVKQVERVLPIFEKEYPKDKHPRKAIELLRAWAQGKMELGMPSVRKLSLDSHASARKSKSDFAKFIARSAGQAVAVWHVPNHVLGVQYYLGKLKIAEKIKK